ncbi:uncharacterized protein LOC123895202 [Trifolium pratense]|nr:uncharacterized protein LOC123889888 [Trifolium pratense]XP_045801390.1 uncharacterized protein LOC123895202 [Trifolium pratense]
MFTKGPDKNPFRWVREKEVYFIETLTGRQGMTRDPVMRSAANGMQNDFTEDELSDQILRQAQNFLPHKYEVVSMVLFQKVRLICYQGMLLCAKFCRKGVQ